MIGSAARLCRACDTHKPLDQFGRNSRNPSGVHHYCKSCTNEQGRKWRLENPEAAAASVKKYRTANAETIKRRNRIHQIEKRFGVPYEEYLRLVAKPCAICGAADDTIVLDHDHENGRVRAGLCGLCNRMLGQGLDEPARLRAGADYIEHWRREHAENP